MPGRGAAKSHQPSRSHQDRHESDPRGRHGYRPKAESEKLEFFHKLKQTPRNPGLFQRSADSKSYFDVVPVLEIAPCKLGIWLRGISESPTCNESLPPRGRGRQRRCFDYRSHSCSQTHRCQTNGCPDQTSLLSLANLRELSAEFAAARNNSAKTDNSLFCPVSTDEKSPTSGCCKVSLSAYRRRPDSAGKTKTTMLCSFPFPQDLATKQGLPGGLTASSVNSCRHPGGGSLSLGPSSWASGAELGTLSWACEGKGC